MKKFYALLLGLLGIGHSFEIGPGFGVGEPFGRAGISLHVNDNRFEATIAKHIAWNDYSASISGRILRLGQKNQVMLNLSYAYNFEEIAAGPFRQRVCLGAFDLHDFGKISGFKAYYGFQLARYFPVKNDFEIVIPIIGLSYSIEIK